MKILLVLLPIICLIGSTPKVSTVYELGPYTVSTLQEGVLYDIEDSNSDNPAGGHKGKNGEMTANVCSNMYLVLGQKQALLVDLSNKISWMDRPEEYLKQIFDKLAGERQRLIAITHNHGDHTGMAYAFADDPSVQFFLPKNDFEGKNTFPSERSTLIEDGYQFDLGGIKVDAIEVKGHSAGSMAYYVEGRNALLSGDAIGSGSGVWLFSLECYKNYEVGFANLMKYIKDPDNMVDKDKLRIYGGHAYQKEKLPYLGYQYLSDMQKVIEDIDSGNAQWEPYKTHSPKLNALFKHGTATITWNIDLYKEFYRDVKQDSSNSIK